MTNQTNPIPLVIALIALGISISALISMYNMPEADVDLSGIETNRALIGVLQSTSAEHTLAINGLRSDLINFIDDIDVVRFNQNDLDDLEDTLQDDIDDNLHEIHDIEDCLEDYARCDIEQYTGECQDELLDCLQDI